ncbi:magnesium transporter [Enteropsectra breve]|nr:magnesium transporter [Enteropsectra breve]
MIIFIIGLIWAQYCVVDGDCKLSLLPDFNGLYCVNHKCQTIKRSGSRCKIPTDCASYSFYGPLACSSACDRRGECSYGPQEKTKYCCKAIPLNGECAIGRPGTLSGCSGSQTCSLANGVATCQERTSNSWMLGSFLSISGNILICLGLNYQKKSYVSETLKILSFEMNTMVLGAAIYTVGKTISFSAYVFGNQSLLAALSATGLVSNSIFAPLINNEIFTWKDGLAIGLVFLGTIVIISNTSRSHIAYSLCELMKMYKNPATVYWLLFIFTAIIFLFFLIKFVERNSNLEAPDEYFSFMQTSRVFFADDGFVCKYAMVLVYIFLSSLIASFTTLSAKSLGEIFDRILTGDRLFASKITWFFICALIGCTLLQIYWLNRALKHYDALLVVPIFHVSWTVLSILTACIYFQDFEHYSSKQLYYFLFGVWIIFSGSFVLSLRIRDIAPSTSENTAAKEKEN